MRTTGGDPSGGRDGERVTVPVALAEATEEPEPPAEGIRLFRDARSIAACLSIDRISDESAPTTLEAMGELVED